MPARFDPVVWLDRQEMIDVVDHEHHLSGRAVEVTPDTSTRIRNVNVDVASAVWPAPSVLLTGRS